MNPSHDPTGPAAAPARHVRGRPAGWLLGSRMPAIAFAALVALLALAAPASAQPKCTAVQGQAFIDDGRYQRALQEFACLVASQPAGVEGYRGRAEAELLLGRFSDAMATYGRVTALVLPVHPDAEATILDGYGDRLAVDPNDIPALTGASFARWWMFDYGQAIPLLNDLLDVRPDDVYGQLFRGSSRLLNGGPKALGAADMDAAIALDPDSPDVRWVVADAYTYGWVDLDRAFAEASLALDGGLDTPRVHAILGAAYNAFGETGAAALSIERHIDLVTAELVAAPALAAGQSLGVDLVPGRTYEIPIAVSAGETLSIATSSKDYWDSIAVLLAPDGSPVLGSDDDSGYHAAFDWVAPATGTYSLRVTFFESLNTGELIVSRD